MIDFDALTLGPCLATFGQPALWRPARGLPLAFTAILDTRYAEVKLDERGAEIVTYRPLLGTARSSFPGALPAQDDIVEVGGQIYRISDPPEADGFGHIRLWLKLAPLS